MSRRVAGEALGTALLLYVIVGSGIAADTLASDPGVQLVVHALVVGLGLAALIAMFLTVSGAHFNPSVTLAFWRTGDIEGALAGRYVAAQTFGAVVGVVAANASFGVAAVSISSTSRGGAGQVFAEMIATFVLVFLILSLVKTDRISAVPAAVGAWIAAAVFATSSTGFANPAVTVARVLTDTYTGISPGSVPAFLVAQLVAGLLAAALAPAFFPERTPQPTPT